MKKLSIVIPVYNEKDTILEILKEVEASPAHGLLKEIIIVDDFSSDGTREILQKLQKTAKYKVFFHDKNYGKESALRTGFSHVTGDFIIIQDADLEYDPSEYANLLQPLADGRADVVYGSRFVGNKPHRVLFFWHYLGNRFLTLLSNIFRQLNLTDMEICYKAFSRSSMQKILPDLKSNRFGIGPEITALIAENNLKIYEVGVSYSGRTYKESKKVNWKDGFSAFWTIMKSGFHLSSFGKDKFKLGLLILLLFLAMFSVFALRPQISGDSVEYVFAMDVLKTGSVPSGFTPNRIITTYLGLQTVIFVDSFIDNLFISWLLVNAFFYIVMGMFFYSLLLKIINNRRATFLGTLFLMTNYAVVVFGLHYLMDMGGWAFYIASLYFSYLYLETSNKRWLMVSSLLVGLGGLFKEYAFLAYVVVFALIAVNYWKKWLEVIKKTVLTSFLAFGPMLAVNLYAYFLYDYTYFDWFFNQPIYMYNSIIGEYTKSFGSLYNFGWFLFLGGAYLAIKRSKYVLQDKNIFFIWLVILSSSIVFVWPIVTRVLFITIPGVVLVTSLLLKEIDRYWYAVLPILALYIASTYLMDSFILNFVNLPF